MKHYKQRQDWVSKEEWFARKQAEEKRRQNRWDAQQKLDEELQNCTLGKEEAEDFCGPRFRQDEDGNDYIQLRNKENMFTVARYLMHYERIVRKLQQHLPHVEYDPRIVNDCPYRYATS